MDIINETVNEEEISAKLDSTQYTRESILKYEKIFGHNFISTGGLETTKEFVATLNLQPGMKVLDVGAGIGGSAFYMAEAFHVSAHGLDLSHNMLEIANERCKEQGLQDKVTFEYGDILHARYENEFDLIYSRDAFLHIADKQNLFNVLLRGLKPGGTLFFTDYCWGEGTHSDEFLAYVAQRGYSLHTVKEYGRLIEAAGFINVLAEDKTKLFGEYLQIELEKLPKDDSMPDIRRSWNEKIIRNQRGEQGWGMFKANKG